MFDREKYDSSEGFDLRDMPDNDFEQYLEHIRTTRPKEGMDEICPLTNETPAMIACIAYILETENHCERCGNCCRGMNGITLSDVDLLRICEHQKLSESKVILKYKLKEKKNEI